MGRSLFLFNLIVFQNSGSSMIQKENILVAVDPSRNYHPALDRVMLNASLRDSKPRIHLFIAVDNVATNTNAKNTDLYTSIDDLNNLVASIKEQGINCTSELCWVDKWQEGMLYAAKRIEADLIVMTDHSNVEQKLFLADSKWSLLRQAKRPVLLVRASGTPHRETILAAVNFQTESADQKELNERIIMHGRWLTDRYNAEFHVVNAYKDSINYPDRGRLQRMAGVESHRIHIKQGAAEDVVADIAQVIDADVVVIGTQARQGVVESIRGNTSERVLNVLTQDVLTIN